MSTKDEALRLIAGIASGSTTANSLQHIVKIAKAALAQPEQTWAKAWDEGYCQGVEDERTSESNIGIAGFGAKVEPSRQNPYKGQPEQPAQQEPVAGQCRFPGVAWSQCEPAHVRMVLDNPHEWKGYEVRYLYDHPPPQRKPLTDEQCDKIFEALDVWADDIEYGLPRDKVVEARQIIREAAHGIEVQP